MKVINILVIFTILIKPVFSQDDVGDPILQYQQSITGTGFTIKIFKIINNPYNAKGLDKGERFIEVKGYRLSDALFTLARNTGNTVIIKSLEHNPHVAFRIEFPSGNFENLWHPVLTSLAEWYNFSVTETGEKLTTGQLHIENPLKLSAYIYKSKEPGTLRSAHVSTAGKISLKGFTLTNLADWLAERKGYSIILNGNDDGKRYAFEFESLPDVDRILELKYGIKMYQDTRLKKIYLVNSK
ncbi:MAG: hypothetical protein N2044_06495 [Cyclobacteriaceae bacterium]|nr:hypothetical protein [Cyclobacteriaceae bacterium]MCX7637481.1 hypothetical protein [Cyclobacteriaceae bacterium]MDW8331662.1 hypothetical protein [Cyclobacteriaceae bacterium]